ncbi:MAG TPA: hypothetical protein PK709_18585, partial [Cyclobacteriaceae bacterium]|nr:hypothetical protein [Cyclobacteriaceae bacterium]
MLFDFEHFELDALLHPELVSVIGSNVPGNGRQQEGEAQYDGRPEKRWSAQTMASSGLVMQMTKASGPYLAMPAPTCSITLRLISR